MALTAEETMNQLTAYKTEQRRIRQVTTDICNAIQMLDEAWTAFDAAIVEGGDYEAAIAAHAETMAKVPGTADAIAGLRAALNQAVGIARAMQAADNTIFPNLILPD